MHERSETYALGKYLYFLATCIIVIGTIFAIFSAIRMVIEFDQKTIRNFLVGIAVPLGAYVFRRLVVRGFIEWEERRSN